MWWQVGEIIASGVDVRFEGGEKGLVCVKWRSLPVAVWQGWQGRRSLAAIATEPFESVEPLSLPLPLPLREWRGGVGTALLPAPALALASALACVSLRDKGLPVRDPASSLLHRRAARMKAGFKAAGRYNSKPSCAGEGAADD